MSSSTQMPVSEPHPIPIAPSPFQVKSRRKEDPIESVKVEIEVYQELMSKISLLANGTRTDHKSYQEVLQKWKKNTGDDIFQAEVWIQTWQALEEDSKAMLDNESESVSIRRGAPFQAGEHTQGELLNTAAVVLRLRINSPDAVKEVVYKIGRRTREARGDNTFDNNTTPELLSIRMQRTKETLEDAQKKLQEAIAEDATHKSLKQIAKRMESDGERNLTRLALVRDWNERMISHFKDSNWEVRGCALQEWHLLDLKVMKLKSELEELEFQCRLTIKQKIGILKATIEALQNMKLYAGGLLRGVRRNTLYSEMLETDQERREENIFQTEVWIKLWQGVNEDTLQWMNIAKSQDRSPHEVLTSAIILLNGRLQLLVDGKVSPPTVRDLGSRTTTVDAKKRLSRTIETTEKSIITVRDEAMKRHPEDLGTLALKMVLKGYLDLQCSRNVYAAITTLIHEVEGLYFAVGKRVEITFLEKEIKELETKIIKLENGEDCHTDSEAESESEE